MKLTLVVPCYNEAENVNLFYEKSYAELQKYWQETEIIFINDGSKDNTWDILKDLYAHNKRRIKIINFSRNFGKEAAVLAGLKESCGEFVGIIDADLQQNPKYIADMVEFLESNSSYQSVAAYQEKRKENKAISACKDAFYKIMSRFTDVDIVNAASDFRVLRREVAEAVISLPEKCRFSKGIFSWVGFNTYYMPYKVEKRVHGKTSWSFWKLMFYALDGITAFSTKPLIVSAAIGLGFCAFSIFLMVLIIIKTLFFGDPVAGYPTLITAILFFTGLQLLFLGIIGQYMSKIYTESKHRPSYIIKEKSGNELN